VSLKISSRSAVIGWYKGKKYARKTMRSIFANYACARVTVLSKPIQVQHERMYCIGFATANCKTPKNILKT